MASGNNAVCQEAEGGVGKGVRGLLVHSISVVIRATRNITGSEPLSIRAYRRFQAADVTPFLD